VKSQKSGSFRCLKTGQPESSCNQSVVTDVNVEEDIMSGQQSIIYTADIYCRCCCFLGMFADLNTKL